MKTNLSLNAPATACRGSEPVAPRAGTLPVMSRCAMLFAVMLCGALTALAQNEAAPGTNAAPAEAAASTPANTAGGGAPATPDVSTNVSGLNLNFRNAPIDLVLEHLSKAAGFIIQMDAPVRGSVSVIGQGLTKDEAVDLLNTELNKNGYAAIRSGTRTIRILDKQTAKSSNNPVKISNDPDSIPDNDEMVTQIIPIRFVEASQLVSDLSPFVSSQATIIANQAGNSIIITDTQANIRHLVEIIKAIDSSAEDVTVVKVFQLKYADPSEMATLLSGLFPDQTGTAQAPIRFGNRGGGFGRGGFGGGFGGGGLNPFAAAFGAGNQGGGNNQSDRIKKRNQVVAVADGRTSSVIVTATKDLMDQITEMIDQLDHPGKAQHMAVIPVHNADASEVLSVLQDTVGANTSRNNRNTQNSPFQTRLQQNQNSTSSSRSTLGTSNNRGGLGGNRSGGGFGGF